MSHLGCCALGVCCGGGEKQAAALTEHFGIPLEAALAIAGKNRKEGHVLVPRSLPAPVSGGDPERDAAFAEAASQRLERLNRHVIGEMKAILTDLGHEARDEQD